MPLSVDISSTRMGDDFSDLVSVIGTSLGTMAKVTFFGDTFNDETAFIIFEMFEGFASFDGMMQQGSLQVLYNDRLLD